MTETARCPSCGSVLDPADASGLCPACLMRLAKAEPEAATQLGTTPPAAASSTSRLVIHDTGEPAAIGPYQILERLGEGGMGIVYLAEQTEPLRRRVAVKVIKVGLATREVVERFDAERQALALMDHPNIAHVYDAGATADGRPYFVMEYVAGMSMTEYCDTHRLSTRDRLALFVHVCAAIQHAHQKGVIHRDLKPTNVLVTEQDGRAIPKVIDFGIAKATERSLVERSMFTEMGSMMGTPEYMSPEQAAGSADIDTTTDVYSLGVLLYELLVGVLPFDPRELRAAGYDEMRRVIRESDPPKPSTRLSSAGEALAGITGNRRTTEVPLMRQLRGDLDWITLKALEKDRRRRYPTVAAFAADVQRYLSHEPVDARPPSAAYRIQKFVRRHRTAVASGITVLAALTGALIVSVVSLVRVDAARDRAERGEYEAAIRLADIDVKGGDVMMASRDLARVPAVNRGLEWRYLWKATNSAERILTPDPEGWRGVSPNSALAFGRDGRDLIYVTRSISSWDLTTGLRVRGERPAVDINVPLALSDDGELVAHYSDRKPGLIVTRTKDATTVFELRAAPACAAFSHDGGRLAAASKDGRVDVFGADGRSVGQLPGERIRRGMPACDLQFSSDDSRLLIAGEGATVVEVSSGRVLWRIGAARMALLSQDGALLAVATADGVVEVRPVAGGSPVSRIAAGGFDAMAFSPDGRILATGGQTVVNIWNVRSGISIDKLLTGDQIAGVVRLAFTPDGERLLAAQRFGKVTVWRTAGFFGASDIQTTAPNPTVLAISADEQWLAVGNRDDGLHVWTLPEMRRVADLREPAASLAVAFDGRGRLVSAGEDKVIRVWDVRTKHMTTSMSGHKGMVVRLAISPDSRVVASASMDGEVIVWNLESGAETERFTCARPLKLVAFDASGTRILAAAGGFDFEAGSMGSQSTICRWDRASRTAEVWTGDSGDPLAFLPDRSGILISHRGPIGLWPLDLRRRTLEMRGHVMDAWSGTTDAAGSRLLSHGLDLTLRIWRGDDGALLLTLPIGRPFASLDAVTLSRSGRYLAAVVGVDNQLGTGAGAARVWDLSSDRSPDADVLVEDLFPRLHLAARVAAAVRADASLSVSVREEALTLISQRGDNFSQLTTTSWNVGRRPNLARADYQSALEEAEAALASAPLNPSRLRVRAMVFYRLGRLDAAANDINLAKSKRSTPEVVDAIVSAMIEAGRHRTVEARAALDQARALLAAQKDPPSPETSALLKEAEGAVTSAEKAR